MLVIKRNNKIVDFDRSKIEIAILKAMKYGSGIYDKDIAIKIANEIEYEMKHCKENQVSDNVTTISIIEDIVYNKLIENKHELTAKAYEGYRAVQSFKREVNTTDESIMGLLNSTNKEVMNENSNKNSYLASTQRDLIAGEVSKDIARRKLIPSHIVQAHDNGVLHFHDADYTMQNIFNCCLINLDDMLQNGTVINEKMVERPRSFETACTIVTQIIAQIASGQYGGNSMTIKHIAPFLRETYNKYYKKYILEFDDATATRLAEDRMMEQLKSGVQTIRYQLSTLATSNGQFGCL